MHTQPHKRTNTTQNVLVIEVEEVVWICHDDAAEGAAAYLVSELVVVEGSHQALPGEQVDAVLESWCEK